MSEANPHEHKIRMLSLELGFVQSGQTAPAELTEEFYKVPDLYMLVYVPASD